MTDGLEAGGCAMALCGASAFLRVSARFCAPPYILWRGGLWLCGSVACRVGVSVPLCVSFGLFVALWQGV